MNYDLVTIILYSPEANPGLLTEIVTVLVPAFQLAELPFSIVFPFTEIEIVESLSATAVILLDAFDVVAV